MRCFAFCVYTLNPSNHHPVAFIEADTESQLDGTNIVGSVVIKRDYCNAVLSRAL